MTLRILAIMALLVTLAGNTLDPLVSEGSPRVATAGPVDDGSDETPEPVPWRPTS